MKPYFSVDETLNRKTIFKICIPPFRAFSHFVNHPPPLPHSKKSVL